MKRPILMIAVALTCGLSHAEGLLKIDKLTLKNGKSYEHVTVTQTTPGEISIQHGDGGLARIPWEQLPGDVAKQLGGFDPAKAEAARKADGEAQTAYHAAADAEAAVMKKPSPAKEVAQTPAKTTKLAVVKIVQSKHDGSTCHISWMEKPGVSAPKKGPLDSDFRLGKTKPVDGEELTSPPVMSGFGSESIFVKGVTGFAPGKTIGVALFDSGGQWEAVSKMYEVPESAGAPPPSYGVPSIIIYCPSNMPRPWWYYTPLPPGVHRLGGG